ncbi:MAG: MmgE/PrpD family protein, partial [Alphaproteobacteria bacterium]
GQFSMPFCAAVALRAGGLAWDDYARHLGDAETLALCRRVSTEVDAAAEAEFPANLAGAARITTARGIFEDFVAAPLGEPGNFVSDAQLRAKFDGLAGPYLPPGRADALAEALLAIDTADDVGAVLRLSRPSGPAAALAG